MADFKNLSEQERELALKILKDLKSGDTNSYMDLYYKDYNEIPVDIETFITDDRYLGRAWKSSDGKLSLYPFWLEQLKKLFPNPFTINFNTVLESGARGLGKSEIACSAICAYIMYKVLCLKDPIAYYHLKSTDKIYFAFMNITKQLVKKIAKDKFQKTIQLSPWFMARGTMTSFEGSPYWVPPDPVSIILGSKDSDVRGLPIFFWFFDEISFIQNQDIDKQKEKAEIMIQAAVAGMMTRFVHDGKNPTMLVVASSKRSDQSFMEEYIKTLEKREGGKTLIIDRAVWEVKPKGTFKEETFFFGLGNKFLESIVIPKDDYGKIEIYRERGYKIKTAPMDFYDAAKEDIEMFLCDYAGISSTSANKYMSSEAVLRCINKNYKNPLPDIIETGNGTDDTAQYYNYFDVSWVPYELKNKPLFIHLDMSISGDMTGIAGVWITGKKPTTDGDPGKDLSFRLAFSTSIKAPKGHQISFEKNRNFIRWLKSAGFNVKEVSSDTFQSYDLQQQLKSEGFNCSILSVDRVGTNKICAPYQFLRSSVYEQRMEMYKSDRLFDEFVDVERNITTGKVDHTPNGHKDALDAVCGATFTASKHAEEYAFNYGENLKATVELNEMINYQDVDDVLNNYFSKSGWLAGGIGTRGSSILDINDVSSTKKNENKPKNNDLFVI